MADQPVPSLARARELKIEQLSAHFANDDLTLEELERRIERVYKAANVAELESITADLKGAVTLPADHVRANLVSAKGNAAAVYEVPNARIVSIMSSTRRVGRWAVPPKLDVLAIMTDAKIDLTHAVLTSNTVDLEMRAVMASLKIIVPPGMRVIVDSSSFMSNVRSRADEVAVLDPPASQAAPIVRITGYAFMADVNIVVRRLDGAIVAGDDDDDDDDDD